MLTPGNQTTEWKLVRWGMVAALTIQAFGMALIEVLPETSKWYGLAVFILGTIKQIVDYLKYLNMRDGLKKEQLKANFAMEAIKSGSQNLPTQVPSEVSTSISEAEQRTKNIMEDMKKKAEH